MKDKKLFLFSCGLVLLCITAVIVLTRTAFNPFFILSNTGEIGDTIAGITAPIIGMFSAVLLYMALREQRFSNEQQTSRNNIDFIFELFKDLQNEIAMYRYDRMNQGAIIASFNGPSALTEFARDYKFSIASTQAGSDATFMSISSGIRISSIIDSWNNLQEHVSVASLSNDLRNTFNAKLDSFYLGNLMYALKNIREAINENPNAGDFISWKLIIFYENMDRLNRFGRGPTEDEILEAL